MASLNKVILIGNLTADPELQKTQSGVSVTAFRIAVQRRFSKQDAPQSDFIDVVAWRTTAEFVTQYFSKGRPILVCGSLQSRSWTDGTSQKHFKTEVVADEVSFIDSAREPATENAQRPIAEAQSNPEPTSFTEVASDVPLPF